MKECQQTESKDEDIHKTLSLNTNTFIEMEAAYNALIPEDTELQHLLAVLIDENPQIIISNEVKVFLWTTFRHRY
jgi:hypothetical protein